MKIAQIKKCELLLLPAVSQELYYVVLKKKEEEMATRVIVSFMFSLCVCAREAVLSRQLGGKTKEETEDKWSFTGAVNEARDAVNKLVLSQWVQKGSSPQL